MTAWQYAQLVITNDSRGTEDTQTILWHGPGQGIGENLSGRGQTVLELLNRAARRLRAGRPRGAAGSQGIGDSHARVRR